MPANPRADRYSHTPRKVFDNAVDNLKLRILRAKEDSRADIGALVARLILVEEALEELMDPLSKKHDCKDPHCKFCIENGPSNGSEELE